MSQLDRVYVGRGDKGNKLVGEFVCQMLDENVEPCELVGKSKKALLHHEILANKYGHQCSSVVNLITITNQCFICSSTFASLQCAQHHVANALSKGKCKADRGYNKNEAC